MVRFNIKVSFYQIDLKTQSHSNQILSRFCVGEWEFEILQADPKIHMESTKEQKCLGYLKKSYLEKLALSDSEIYFKTILI